MGNDKPKPDPVYEPEKPDPTQPETRDEKIPRPPQPKPETKDRR